MSPQVPDLSNLRSRIHDNCSLHDVHCQIECHTHDLQQVESGILDAVATTQSGDKRHEVHNASHLERSNMRFSKSMLCWQEMSFRRNIKHLSTTISSLHGTNAFAISIADHLVKGRSANKLRTCKHCSYTSTIGGSVSSVLKPRPISLFVVRLMRTPAE